MQRTKSVCGTVVNKIDFFGGWGWGDLFDSHRVRQFRSNRSDNILNSENRVMSRYRREQKVFRMCDVACKDGALSEAQFRYNWLYAVARGLKLLQILALQDNNNNGDDDEDDDDEDDDDDDDDDNNNNNNNNKCKPTEPSLPISPTA